jgi:class 3 adenylate cyclase/tetratricopeptide (TPR) repeat protein/DNA polymerase III delta prime subunit
VPVPRTATASVLFVDVVESTALRARLGEERADALARELESRIGVIVGDHHGQVVKGLGDGVLAVFDSAVEAVGAAVAIQQRSELAARGSGGSGDPDVRLRVGLSVGDVSFEGGDVLGTPVVEASRLCGAAQPGQILVADLVRALSRGRGSFVFEPMGALSLKGLPEPLAACQVMWEPLPQAEAADDHQVPFPGLLSSGISGTYVGRDAVTDSLATMLDAVVEGRTSVAAALLSGEPGIGKTRTAAELARRAHARGVLVLYGCCDEELGVPFQPYVEALDFYSSHHPAPRLGRLPGELVRLCPELTARVDDLPPPASSDPRTEEYRLFEAVSSWLVESSRPDGLVLVLDDIHWATRSTLLLLAHLLRAAAADDAARLLVVATYRDTELDRTHPLNSVLADLRRLPGVVRLDLRGLSLDESVVLVQSVAGHELDDDGLRLARQAFDETEGNPLFMGEVLRHFVETAAVRLVDGRWQVGDPGEIEVPEGVRDVIGRRLGRLSEEANQLLAVAAVIGRDFDLDLLAHVTDLDDTTVLDALDEACRSRVIEEAGRDRFRFFHAMVKETLYAELSSARRRRLHESVLRVLEKLRPEDAVALAHHAVEAGPVGGDTGPAVAHLLGAAAQASAARDIAGAEGFYRQAIDLIDAGEPDPHRRAEASCGLGEAQRDLGNPEFRETLLATTRSALRLGRTDLAARAAIANFRGTTSVINAVDAERVEALEAVLATYGDARTAEVARLGATLAEETTYDPSVSAERRLALADRSIEIARELGDPAVLADVLLRAARTRLVPDRAASAPPVMAEAVALADEVGDPFLAAMTRIFANAACLGVGDIAGARRYMLEGRELARTDCPPAVVAATLANCVQYHLYDGELEEATALNDRFLAQALEMGMVDAEQWWAANTLAITYVQGTAGDLADAAGDFADRYPDAAAWRCTHAFLLTEAGRLDEARDVVDRYDLRRPERFPVNDFSLLSQTYLGYVALGTGDRELGRATEAVLRPHAELWANVDIFTNGPISVMLAGAVGAQGRYDEADELYARADALLDERGLQLVRNPTAWYRATSLLQSDEAEHHERAEAVIREAVARTSAAGLDRLTARLEALSGSAG